MSAEAGPNILYNGLVLHLDAANFRSYDSRENLFQYSEDFSNSYWTKVGTTITLNSGIAPDGTNTANLVTSTNSGGSYFERTSAISDTATYTYSVYIRGIGSSVGKTLVFGNYNNNTPRQNTSFTLTGEWQRVSATFTPTQTSLNNLYLHSIGQGATLTTSDTFLVWGAQLEKSSATSIYASTTSSTITRSTIWTDLSGNGNNATLINTPIYNSSNNGYFTFNGTTQYGTISESTSLRNISTITIESFFYLNSYAIWAGIIGRNDNTKSVYGLNFSPSTQRLRFNYNNVSPWTNNVETTATVSTGQWIYGAATYDGTNVRMYLNGSLDKTQNIGSIVFDTNAGFPIDIAFDNPGADEYLNGRIGYISIYNRALSNTEISQNFNSLKGRYGL